ncbi:hypothetical protein Taro_053852 [Colocasia esculenta]|uniref:Uncharacterized protein n=1 Tax=Colocasia esculenta TaxID=4460 RepID=A0A843XNS5_COLES|nr:hypothetical protein [Colocasia esculenta]
MCCGASRNSRRGRDRCTLTSGNFVVQPARRPCGNPWSEENYRGLGQGVTSPTEGISDGEFITSQERGFPIV